MTEPRVPALLARVGWRPVAATLAVAAQVVLPSGTAPALGAYLATTIVVVAIAATAARRRGRDLPRPWWIVLAAITASLVLDLARAADILVPGLDLDPVTSGGLYLVPYAILFLALLGLVLSRDNRRDSAALLDAAIVVLGLGFGLFFLAAAIAAPPEGLSTELLTTLAATLAVGMPSLTVATWLAFAGGPPRGAVAFLLAAVAAQSTGDSWFGLNVANPALNLPSDAPWLASIVLLAAAIHTAAKNDAPADNAPVIRDPHRQWLLVLAIIAPAIDSAQATLADQPRELISVIVLAVAGAAIARITYLLRQVSRLVADTAAYRELTAELEKARGEYQNLVDASPGMSWTSRIIDPATGDTDRPFVGPQIAGLSGYPAAEFQSGARRWRDVTHPDDRAATAERYRARVRELAAGTLPEGVSFADEYRIVRADGRIRWVRDTHHFVRDLPGGGGTIHGLVLDITEQREAQEEVRASEARFRALVDQLPAVVLLRENVGSEAGPLSYVSQSSDRILGRTADELRTGTGPWTGLFDEADMPAVNAARIRHFANRTRESVVSRVGPRAGRRDIARRVEITWVPVAGPDPDHWLSLAIVFDVTALYEAQEQLRAMNVELESRIASRTTELVAARQEAERANRAKSEFLSSMSHELRTPLNAILGFGQLLQMASLAQPDAESADEIVRAGRHLLEMIESVLELSRLDAGRISLSIEPVELEPVIREVIDLGRPGADERGLQLVDELAGGPPVIVLADRRRLVQVLLNLVSNGLRYNRPGGRVTIRASVHAERVSILVADTGIGIAEERLPKLFEPFETLQGDHSVRQSLGLGLALSARLAGLMGGSIGVESRLGEGTTFEVDLPRAADGSIVVDPDLPAAGRRKVDATVLYIEDNLANLTLVERVLAGRFGVRVLAAIQGRLGLELAREHRPSLILLDLHLPDVEPGDVIRELKADERTAMIPIVILSSDIDEKVHDEMRAIGAVEFLSKPLDLVRFVRVIEQWLPAR